MPNGVYATYAEIKAYINSAKNANLNIKDDVILKQFAEQMSRKFDAHCKRKFYPRLETRYFDHPMDRSNLGPNRGLGTTYPNIASDVYGASDDARCLELDDDLLAVISLKTDNGVTTISASDYHLKTGASYNHPPYDRIELAIDGTQQVFGSVDTYQKANEVEAVWGYHENYSDAWQQVDTVQDDPLSSSATTITVNDVDGADELGITPRFKIQQLIRFGTGNTAEMAYITNLSPEANTLTVVRGINGSTAAEQAQGTAIFVWRPMSEIHHALLALGAWAYRRKDNVGSDTDQPIASSTGVILMPPVLPKEIMAMIEIYRRKTYRS